MQRGDPGAGRGLSAKRPAAGAAGGSAGPVGAAEGSARADFEGEGDGSVSGGPPLDGHPDAGAGAHHLDRDGDYRDGGDLVDVDDRIARGAVGGRSRWLMADSG